MLGKNRFTGQFKPLEILVEDRELSKLRHSSLVIVLISPREAQRALAILILIGKVSVIRAGMRLLFI